MGWHQVKSISTPYIPLACCICMAKVWSRTKKACQLFQRSHKKGNPYASFELGKLYEAGRGSERNTDLAGKCYRVAFLGFLNLEKKSRDDTLWYRIGTMYLQGVGTEADEKEAESISVSLRIMEIPMQPINWQSCTSVRKRRNENEPGRNTGL